MKKTEPVPERCRAQKLRRFPTVMIITDQSRNLLVQLSISEVLPAVCDVYLSAREAGALTVNQQNIAAQCEILVRAFAKGRHYRLS